MSGSHHVSHLRVIRALRLMKRLMKPTPAITTILMAVLAAFFAAACDARLALVARPGDGEGEGEGAGEGEGEGEGAEGEPDFCETQPADAEFPVKVLYVIDLSGSMQFTDQAGLRFGAFTSHIASLSEGTRAAVLGWGGSVWSVPAASNDPDAPRFVAPDELALPEQIGIQDVMTDMEGAFAATYRYILNDAIATPVEERPRTRYVVVFFTDGLADPLCCREEDERVAEIVDPFGCPLEPWEVAQPGVRYCDARAEPDLCNDEAFLEQFQTNYAEVVFGTSGVPELVEDGAPLERFAVGSERNRPARLNDQVRIVKSVEGFGVGAVDLHFALLRDLTLPDGVAEIYGLNACRLEAQVAGLADAAEGTFEIFEGAADISLVDVDVSPRCP